MPSSREILSNQNPGIINAWNGRSYGNTESSKGAYDEVVFTEAHPYLIQEWTDFNYNAIELAYGDILDEVPANFKSVNTPTSTPRTIAEEKGIDKLGEAWTCNIVRAPLKAAAAVIRPRPPVAGVTRTDPALTSFAMKWKHPKFPKTDLDPDWAIFEKLSQKMYKEELTKQTPKPLAYVVGDSKMCQKWQSAWLHTSLAAKHVDKSPAVPISGEIISKSHDVTSERLKPLAQVATYCRFAETRYAFILTQQELVALRIRRVDGNQFVESMKDPKKLHAAIEYKAVPWNASGPGRLTVNLAIWALGCMGMNENHRDMEGPKNTPLDSMVRLTKWKYDKTKSLYWNVISGRVIGELEWKKMGAKTAIATFDGSSSGDSFTSSFTQSKAITSLNQAMNNINLNSAAGQGNSSTQANTQANKQTSTNATNAAKKPTPPSTSPSSKSGEASAPPKYIIEGTKGPSFELKSSGDKIWFQKDARTVPLKKDMKKGQYYYTVADPKDAKKLRAVYLKKV